MSNEYDFEAWVGDNNVPIAGTLYDDAGAVVNLTTCTGLIMRARALGSSAFKFELTVSLTSPLTGGRWSHALVAANIDTPGVYELAWEATFTGGRIQTIARKSTGAKLLMVVHAAA
jgi:hypothetical protein